VYVGPTSRYLVAVGAAKVGVVPARAIQYQVPGDLMVGPTVPGIPCLVPGSDRCQLPRMYLVPGTVPGTR